MSAAQRVAVVIGLVFMVGLALWPPWYMKVTQAPYTIYTSTRRHAVWWRTPTEFYFGSTRNQESDNPVLVRYVRIDRDRLALEWFAVAGLAAAVVVLLGGRRDRRPRAAPPAV
jgi:hypothetical protein